MTLEELMKIPGYATVLTAPEVTLSEGGTAILDTGKLASPNREGLMVFEIAFATRMDSPPTTQPDLLGLTVTAKLMAGALDLTENFVPICLFDRVWQDARELFQDSVAVSTTDDIVYHRWRPRRPIILPPGQPIRVYFGRTVDTLGSTVAATAYAHCRAFPWPAGTHRVAVPYVSSYIHPVNTSVVTNSISDSLSLNNPLTVPLWVDYFVGRIANLVPATSLSEYTVNDISTDQVTLRMRDSLGVQVMQAGVPFYNAFDLIDRTMPAGFGLDPNERVQMFFDNVPAGAYPMVAAVGYREVTL